MHITELPKECLLSIFQYLPLVDLVVSVRQTCVTWNKLSYNGTLWKTVNLGCRSIASHMSDQNFLKLLSPVATSVEEIIFGPNRTLSEVSVLHEDIHCSSLVGIDLRGINVDTKIVGKLLDKYPKIEKLFVELSLAESCVEFLECLQSRDCSYFKSLSLIFSLEEDLELDFSNGQEFKDVLSENATLVQLNSLLADVISHFTALQSFSVEFSFLSDETLYKIISSTKNLVHLDISGCSYLTGKGLRALSLDCGLVSLNIDGTKVDDDSIKLVADRCHHLRSVSLEDCLMITDVGVEALARNCPNITSFSINHRMFNKNTSDKLIWNTKEKQDNPQHLQNLNTNAFLRITDSSIISLVKNCVRLRSLSLAGCMAITDEAVQQISLSCSHLTILNLSTCVRISDTLIDSLFLTCPFLESLTLRNCVNVTKIFFSSGTNNKNQLLRDSNMLEKDHEVFNATNSSSKTSKPELVSVDESPDGNSSLVEAVDRTHDGNSSSTQEVCTPSPLPKLDFRLSELNLSFCNQICDESLQYIASSCPRLRKLFLCSCIRVTDFGVGAVAQMCPLLNTLDISGWSLSHGETMQLTDTCLVELATHSHNLSLLLVARCPLLTITGVKTILSKCTKLHKVLISTGVHFRVHMISLHNSLQHIDAYTSLKTYKDDITTTAATATSSLVVLELYPCNKRLL
ncbi:dynein regulatory complex subunit 6-like [Argonauta hians]